MHGCDQMTVFEEIVAAKKREVEEKKSRYPRVMPCEAGIGRNRTFRSALKRPRISVIAEIKRKSPSCGVLRQDADPVRLAGLFERNGAEAVSVLTDPIYFGGSLNDLQDVKQAVRLPVLRKDFIVDDCQIFESLAAGADAVLLIVKALSAPDLKRFLGLSESLGMEVLVEVHNASELERALAANARIIGVNNRDLDTFRVDRKTSLHLVREIPPDRIAVSESGIRTREDVQEMEAAGFQAVLVGETLMRSEDAGAALRGLRGV